MPPEASPEGAGHRIRVLIVDDSTTVRAVLRRLLEATGLIEIVGSAADGVQAIEEIRRVRPDVVTLDVEMPRMNGLQTLEELFKGDPVPVVMVSSLTAEGADATIRALELGAVDFIEKPSIGGISEAMVLALTEKIRSAAHAQVRARGHTRGPVGAVGGHWDSRVLVIGASTGGPQAVRTVMTSLPPDFGLPVVIVQHMPAGFTRSLAQRLNALGPLPVTEAEPGVRLERGRALLAPGGYHLEFDAARRVLLTDGPTEHGVRPSVNVTLKSLARLPGTRPLTVILTGMGRDGVRGCELVRRVGGSVIAEDASTCVVYGMPRAVAEAGLTDEVVPLHRVGSAIVRHAQKRAAGRIGNGEDRWTMSPSST